jgi:hypothetical protein
MNRDQRTHLAMSIRRMNHDSRESIQRLIGILSGMIEDEQEKLGSLPDSLSGSIKADGMEDAISMLEEAASKAEEAIAAIDEVADICGADLRKGKLARIECSAPPGAGDQGTKCIRLQLLVSRHMSSSLKALSEKTGCSVNSLANKAFLTLLSAGEND